MNAPVGSYPSLARAAALLAASCALACAPAKPADPLPPAVSATSPTAASASPAAAASSSRPDDRAPNPDAGKAPRFTLVLPGNRIAKIPVSVVESFVDAAATANHGLEGTTSMKHVDENNDWHNDYEFGECIYDKGLGVTRAVAWHRHPFGSEYSELYE